MREDPIHLLAQSCPTITKQFSDQTISIFFAIEKAIRFPALIPTSALLKDEVIVWVVAVVTTFLALPLTSWNRLPWIVSLAKETLEAYV